MKQNKKGFTLVELIVVMAIIAVLAAILVPTMLGFMNNAKYTQANANAKTIYTAVNSVVADYCTDHAALTVNGTGTLTAADIAANNNISIGGKDFKLGSYLEGMTGNGYVKLNGTGTGVEYATWTLGAAWTSKVSKSAQKDGTALSAGNPIGGYPLGA